MIDTVIVLDIEDFDRDFNFFEEIAKWARTQANVKLIVPRLSPSWGMTTFYTWEAIIDEYGIEVFKTVSRLAGLETAQAVYGDGNTIFFYVGKINNAVNEVYPPDSYWRLIGLEDLRRANSQGSVGSYLERKINDAFEVE